MVAPRKYPDELRERATRMAMDARKNPATRTGDYKRVADQLGVHPEALRTWVKRAEVDEGLRPGTTARMCLTYLLARERVAPVSRPG